MTQHAQGLFSIEHNFSKLCFVWKIERTFQKKAKSIYKEIRSRLFELSGQQRFQSSHEKLCIETIAFVLKCMAKELLAHDIAIVDKFQFKLSIPNNNNEISKLKLSRQLMNIRKCLVEFGYADGNYKGYFDGKDPSKSFEGGIIYRFDNLSDFILNEFYFKKLSLTESPRKKFNKERVFPVQIRLDSEEDILNSSGKKDKKSKKLMNILEYNDQDSVKEIERTILRIEKHINSYHYSIPEYKIDDFDNVDELRKYVKTYMAGRSLNCTQLYRAFHEDLEHGGRYYGKYHCYIKKEFRDKILIDGKETIQLDFKAAFPSILYIISGNKLSKNQDLYHIDALIGEVPRSFIKRIYVIILNAKDKKNAYQSIRSEYNKNKEEYENFLNGKMTDTVIDFWISKILEQYPFFREYIFDRRSSALAVNYESSIATEVYKQAIKNKVPVVDIYDCILCCREDKDIVLSMMITACMKILGQSLNIDIE